MHRSITLSALSLALVLGASACQSTSSSETKADTSSTTTESKQSSSTKSEAKTGGKKALDEQAQMELYMKYATPDAGHQRLEPMVGSFKANTTMWMKPGEPAEISTATSKNEWILGGRFLKSEYTGSMAGGPFAGIGMTGFDVAKQQYVGMWWDTWNTAMMPASYGTADASGKKFTMHRTYECPVMGLMKARDVTTIEDNDHYMFEMWMTGADGKEHKAMEIKYTRVNS